MKIKAIMDFYCLNQTEMAAKIGIHQTNLSEMLRGKRSCGDAIIAKVRIAMPEINPMWLLTGEGEMLNPQQSATVQQNNYSGNNNYVVGNGNRVDCGCEVVQGEEVSGIPIIPTALSRQPDIDILEWLEGRKCGVERCSITADGIAIDVWHRVRDNSLMPTYRTGDMLGLWAYPKGKEKPIPGKLYAVDTWSNGLIVRLLFPSEGGYRAHAFNAEEYPDFVIDAEDVIRIYRVMIMVRI